MKGTLNEYRNGEYELFKIKFHFDKWGGSDVPLKSMNIGSLLALT